MDIDLSNLPVDIFIYQITYLPFSDVVSVCQSNSKLHDYCVNPKYNLQWKKLIDDTFGNIMYYNIHLKNLWKKLNMVPGTYNYIIYTQFIKTLHPSDQLRIYYKQGDMTAFNDPRFNDHWRLVVLNEDIKRKYGNGIYGIKYSDGTFRIVEYNSDIRRPSVKQGKKCNVFKKDDLIKILTSLNIPLNPTFNRTEICEQIESYLLETNRVVDLTKINNFI